MGIVEEDIVWEIEDFFTGKLKKTGKSYFLKELTLLAPCLPSKIVAVGLNYIDHIKEMEDEKPKEPILFLKPPSTIIASGEEIKYPSSSKQVDYEAELAVVIAKKCQNIAFEDAFDYILGYTCANDVTARDLQKKDGQWTRAKSFDTFLPLGPFINTDIDSSQVAIRSFLNGELKQNGNSKDLIFSVPELLAYISKIMTLNVGDVVITGTPVGVGSMLPGDIIEIEIDGIGKITNKVIKLD